MRNLLIVLSVLLFPLGAARADVDIGMGISVPGDSIGINMPAYPMLVPVPDYPVYYDPSVDSNYFFYDGLYWVFAGDDWYVSSWYNGPWQLVVREYVPVYVLRIPVRYYRFPPPYFFGWYPDQPPHWGEHWGPGWEQRRHGWDQWDRHSIPRPAPLPSYQRKYSGERYPRELEQQHMIRSERYRYHPHDPVTKQYYQQQRHYPKQQKMEREYKREERGQDSR